MVNIDVHKYHTSISEEFLAIKDRVRLLIGRNHWGEEGRFKEVILMNYLKKHLPSHLSVGTGFIMKHGNNESISKQIDIIIYENNSFLIFKEDDFIIVHPKNVVGVIEVKSTFRSNEFNEILAKAQKINELVNRPIFNGIFYFDKEGNAEFEQGSRLERIIRQSSGAVNHIAIADSTFLKFWPEGNRFVNNNSPSMSVYKIGKLTFSYFLSNLIQMTYALNRNDFNELVELEWFLYPIEGGKEDHRTNNIVID